MEANDFTLSHYAEKTLILVDELVEAGIPREVSERLVDGIITALDLAINTSLDYLDETFPILNERAFAKSALVAQLYQWAQDRLPMSATAQSLILAQYNRGEAQ